MIKNVWFETVDTPVVEELLTVDASSGESGADVMVLGGTFFNVSDEIITLDLFITTDPSAETATKEENIFLGNIEVDPDDAWIWTYDFRKSLQFGAKLWIKISSETPGKRMVVQLDYDVMV